jgi:hypothetical protein
VHHNNTPSPPVNNAVDNTTTPTLPPAEHNSNLLEIPGVHNTISASLPSPAGNTIAITPADDNTTMLLPRPQTTGHLPVPTSGPRRMRSRSELSPSAAPSLTPATPTRGGLTTSATAPSGFGFMTRERHLASAERAGFCPRIQLTPRKAVRVSPELEKRNQFHLAGQTAEIVDPFTEDSMGARQGVGLGLQGFVPGIGAVSRADHTRVVRRRVSENVSEEVRNKPLPVSPMPTVATDGDGRSEMTLWPGVGDQTSVLGLFSQTPNVENIGNGNTGNGNTGDTAGFVAGANGGRHAIVDTNIGRRGDFTADKNNRITSRDHNTTSVQPSTKSSEKTKSSNTSSNNHNRMDTTSRLPDSSYTTMESPLAPRPPSPERFERFHSPTLSKSPIIAPRPLSFHPMSQITMNAQMQNAQIQKNRRGGRGHARTQSVQLPSGDSNAISGPMRRLDCGQNEGQNNNNNAGKGQNENSNDVFTCRGGSNKLDTSHRSSMSHLALGAIPNLAPPAINRPSSPLRQIHNLQEENDIHYIAARTPIPSSPTRSLYNTSPGPQFGSGQGLRQAARLSQSMTMPALSNAVSNALDPFAWATQSAQLLVGQQPEDVFGISFGEFGGNHGGEGSLRFGESAFTPAIPWVARPHDDDSHASPTVGSSPLRGRQAGHSPNRLLSPFRTPGHSRSQTEGSIRSSPSRLSPSHGSDVTEWPTFDEIIAPTPRRHLEVSPSGRVINPSPVHMVRSNTVPNLNLWGKLGNIMAEKRDKKVAAERGKKDDDSFSSSDGSSDTVGKNNDTGKAAKEGTPKKDKDPEKERKKPPPAGFDDLYDATPPGSPRKLCEDKPSTPKKKSDEKQSSDKTSKDKPSQDSRNKQSENKSKDKQPSTPTKDKGKEKAKAQPYTPAPKPVRQPNIFQQLLRGSSSQQLKIVQVGKASKGPKKGTAAPPTPGPSALPVASTQGKVQDKSVNNGKGKAAAASSPASTTQHEQKVKGKLQDVKSQSNPASSPTSSTGKSNGSSTIKSSGTVKSTSTTKSKRSKSSKKSSASKNKDLPPLPPIPPPTPQVSSSPKTKAKQDDDSDDEIVIPSFVLESRRYQDLRKCGLSRQDAALRTVFASKDGDAILKRGLEEGKIEGIRYASSTEHYQAILKGDGPAANPPAVASLTASANTAQGRSVSASSTLTVIPAPTQAQVEHNCGDATTDIATAHDEQRAPSPARSQQSFDSSLYSGSSGEAQEVAGLGVVLSRGRITVGISAETLAQAHALNEQLEAQNAVYIAGAQDDLQANLQANTEECGHEHGDDSNVSPHEFVRTVTQADVDAIEREYQDLAAAHGHVASPSVYTDDSFNVDLPRQHTNMHPHSQYGQYRAFHRPGSPSRPVTGSGFSSSATAPQLNTPPTLPPFAFQIQGLHRDASASSLHQPPLDSDGAPFSPSEYESDADWEDVSSPVLPPAHDHDHASDIIDLDEYYADARLAHGADGDRQLYAGVGMTLGNNQTMLSVIEEGEEEEEEGLGAGERRLPPVYRY